MFTSVLPDDTKRSLLYGNVLVMSRLITLDSAMAPTAHTQFSVWNTEPDPSDVEEKTGRGLNIKEGRREGREEEEEEDYGTSRVEWRWNKWCDESLLWRRNWSNARTFSRHNKSRLSPEDFFRLSRECGMFCDGVKKHIRPSYYAAGWYVYWLVYITRYLFSQVSSVSSRKTFVRLKLCMMTDKADMLGVAANPLFQIFKNLPGMVIWPFDFLDFPSATTNLKKRKITSEWRGIKPLRFKFQRWGSVDTSEAAAVWARAVLSTLRGAPVVMFTRVLRTNKHRQPTPSPINSSVSIQTGSLTYFQPASDWERSGECFPES